MQAALRDGLWVRAGRAASRAAATEHPVCPSRPVGRRSSTSGERWISLGRLPHRKGKPKRDVNATYQGTVREPVDVIVFHDPQFQEPWFLLVPAHSEAQLSTEQVVALYRERMFVELTFRDWKTHLGVRGLRLEVDAAAQLGRLLLALSLAYILAVLLGACQAARRVRADCEVLRCTPRHGTQRRLGSLTVGILLLSLARFAHFR